MPRIEKRLARYSQLYSCVGFVHSFRSLRVEEVRRLLAEHWTEMVMALPAEGIADQDAITAIVRITGGNFRLLHLVLSRLSASLPSIACPRSPALRSMPRARAW
jgi:hypothetical protein